MHLSHSSSICAQGNLMDWDLQGQSTLVPQWNEYFLDSSLGKGDQ